MREPGAGESAGDAPPAATAVAKSDAEPEDAKEIVRLRREIADKEKRLKDRETRLSELEDENHRLKAPKKSDPAPAPEAKKGINDWLWD